MSKFIRCLSELGIKDVSQVGGKNASLGEMIANLSAYGISVPGGFVVTADAYSELLKEGNLYDALSELLSGLGKNNTNNLAKHGSAARKLIIDAGLPTSVQQDICLAYKKLEERYGKLVDVAVRSSATAEDLPEASFAGQQESFLNVCGEEALLQACLNCFASLFTDRAIAYRIDNGFDHMSVRLSIGVQKMVRSDKASAGVMFTLDPESGFRDMIIVTSAYGLGENIVGGRVDPDEWLIFKPMLDKAIRPIVRHKVGSKQWRMIYSKDGEKSTNNVEVPINERQVFSLDDSEVIRLARWAKVIENHYSEIYGKATAMDIEWAKDGLDGQLYIVQARPETIYSAHRIDYLETYRLQQEGKVLLKGRSIGQKIGSGPARLIKSPKELEKFQAGDVLVADMTDPDWEPIMKKASAIITNRGGRTCHAAIVSREIGVPCVVGTGNGTEVLTDGEDVTVSCASGDAGFVYAGKLPFIREQVPLKDIPKTKTKIMLNLANPSQALSLAHLPVAGVGLAREEFIIANDVKVHPLALTRFDQLEDKETKEIVERLSARHKPRENYFVEKLAEGIAMIASAFYPREVIVRLSDFKTNEYANLIGGKQFEPKEENPMIGFRGASRYYDKRYRDGFALECRAIKMVRSEMGLTNVKIMVPFCRTPEEGKLVLAEMALHDLVRGEDGLEVYVMCEIPSNVISADEFAEIFDGFSIGSNDLTQLVLGLDRDSEIVSHLFDERNAAVKKMISQAIAACKKAGRKIGICGQAPSDYPEFARFLVEQGIDSISLNEDAVLSTLVMLAKCEKASLEPSFK